MKAIHAVLALVMAATGCSTSGVAIPIGTKKYPPTDPEAIVILSEKPSCTHSDIALVDGTAATDDYFTQERTQAAALNAMRQKAAQLGAHAIVITGKGNRPYGGVLWEKVQISGTAIRYADPACAQGAP